MFREFDRDNSGQLTQKEWKKAMKRLGYQFNKGDAKRVFYMVDKDRSGQINEREFAEFYASQ